MPLLARSLRVVSCVVVVAALAFGASGCDTFSVRWAGPSRLEITLVPRLLPSPGVAVLYRLAGQAARSVRSLAIAPRDLGVGGVMAVRHLSVRDDRGPIDTECDERGGRFVLQRPVFGALSVSYLADSTPGPSRIQLAVRPQTVKGVGYSFLALPSVEGPLRVRLAWDLHAVDAPEALSSYGVGRLVHATTSTYELAHAYYLAGPLRVHTQQSAAERLVTVGPVGFDPAQALALCADAMAAARALFGPGDEGPYSFIFQAEPGAGHSHDGLALHRAFSIWLDPSRQLDARLRLLIAHELSHQWLGRRVRLVRPDGRDARWFSEGFAVHYARELSRRARLVDDTALASDAARDLAWRHTHRDGSGPPRATDDYHRGALYAAELDAALRGAGRGTLDDLVLSLLRRAGDGTAPLPEAAFRQEVSARLGVMGVVAFDTFVAGIPVEEVPAAVR